MHLYTLTCILYISTWYKSNKEIIFVLLNLAIVLNEYQPTVILYILIRNRYLTRLSNRSILYKLSSCLVSDNANPKKCVKWKIKTQEWAFWSIKIKFRLVIALHWSYLAPTLVAQSNQSALVQTTNRLRSPPPSQCFAASPELTCKLLVSRIPVTTGRDGHSEFASFSIAAAWVSSNCWRPSQQQKLHSIFFILSVKHFSDNCIIIIP